MKLPRKKLLKDILSDSRGLEQTSLCNGGSLSRGDEAEMLCDGKSLVDRLKNAYRKRKRDQKIDALKNSDSLWRGLQ